MRKKITRKVLDNRVLDLWLIDDNDGVFYKAVYCGYSARADTPEEAISEAMKLFGDRQQQ